MATLGMATFAYNSCLFKSKSDRITRMLVECFANLG